MTKLVNKPKKVTCSKCGKEFEDVNFMPKLPLAERTLCNDCVDKEWRKKKNE